MERVLIVDDDPDIVRLVSYNLSQPAIEVQTASTGREALRTRSKAASRSDHSRRDASRTWTAWRSAARSVSRSPPAAFPF